MLFLTAAVPAEETLGVLEIFLRLLCAMAVGLVIGTEREYSNRPAGMRTHILVALGACAVMITSQMIYFQYHAYGANPDPARLPAQIITGVGFLGAGTILREGTHVKGLTTAASLWTVACLGIAAGGGYYAVAILGTLFIIITLTIFEILQNKLVGPEANLRYYWIETTDVTSALHTLNTSAEKQSAIVKDLATRRLENGNQRIIFRIKINSLHWKARREHFLESLTADPSVVATHILTHEDIELETKE